LFNSKKNVAIRYGHSKQRNNIIRHWLGGLILTDVALIRWLQMDVHTFAFSPLV
jgi:hypothetical protein